MTTKVYLDLLRCQLDYIDSIVGEDDEDDDEGDDEEDGDDAEEEEEEPEDPKPALVERFPSKKPFI